VAKPSKKVPFSNNTRQAGTISACGVGRSWYAPKSADPAPTKPNPVRAQARKVRSAARMSRAIEPEFFTVIGRKIEFEVLHEEENVVRRRIIKPWFLVWQRRGRVRL
jgi:hypothetical protein